MSTLYWITILGNLNAFALVIMFISIFVACITGIGANASKQEKMAMKLQKRLV